MTTRALAQPPTVERLPITQARIHLGSVVKRVHLDKACFILEKDGIPVAALIDVDQFEDYLELQDPKVQAEIRKSRDNYRAGRTRPLAALLADTGTPEKTASSRRRKA